jgi:hypothetical protein
MTEDEESGRNGATPSLGMRVILEDDTQQERRGADVVRVSDVENESSSSNEKEVVQEEDDDEEETHSSPSPQEPITNLNSRDSALPVASLVEPRPEVVERARRLRQQRNAVPIVTAVEQDEVEIEKQKAKQKRLVCGMIVGAIIIMLAIVLGTVFGTRSRNNNNSASTAAEPTPSPTLSTESAAVQMLIESVSLDGGASLQNETSPQSTALEWLLKDNEGNNATAYENWRLIQRYALAVLYYSTSGESWLNNENWLTPEHECEWYSTAFDPVCDENDGRYLRIILIENDLVGTVPMELALLSDSLRKYDTWKRPLVLINNDSHMIAIS